MARLERGKGKAKQVYTITRRGVTLRLQQEDRGELHLPGYRRCASEAAAREVFAAEVRSLIDDGLKPADDEAKAIAAAMEAEEPAGPPTLPVRRDLAVYNEATGFVVTSRRMAGKTLDEGGEAWVKAAKKGDLLPLMLVQDDPFIIRVVAGEPLSAQESEEWVARIDWHLNVSDGRLCITGGSVFSNEDYDADDPYYEGYVAELAIPKGRYRATLYTQVHGVNGGAVLDHVAGGEYGSGEELDAWWARTRGGEPRPAWDDEELAGFLLHLEPVEKAPTKGLSELPEGGWFGGAENARKPERCPRGLVAKDVVRRKETSPSGWTYVRDVAQMAGDRTAKALRGGRPVVLPLTGLAFAARIAWFASRWVVFELRVSHPSGLGDLGARGWPADVIVVEEDGGSRILFGADIQPRDVFLAFGAIGAELASLPDGASLELLAAPAGSMDDGSSEAGYLRLGGALHDGAWSITSAFPAVDAATLEAAIALAREASSGSTIAARDAAEGEAILARARREFGPHIADAKPRFVDGVLRVRPDAPELLLMGVAAFAERFGATWPVVSIAAPDDDDEDDEDGDGLFPAAPIKGAEVLRAPSGRTYLQTMALLLSEDVASTAQARERAIVARAMGHVGDLVCDAFENVAVRGYAKAGGPSWGFLLCAAPDEVVVQLASFFDGGGVLVTSTDPNARDRAEAKVFRTGVPGGNTRDILEAHEARLAELAATLGAPLPTEPSMAAFAQALDRVVDVTS